MKSNDTEHLLDLITSSPTIIYTLEPSGGFATTAITENLTRFLGYRPSDMIGDSSFWMDHLHPDDREATLAGMTALFENGSHEHEYRIRHADGSYRWMSDELRFVYDDEGAPLEIVGFWVDITERKTLLHDLHRNAARFHSLVDALSYGVDEIDRVGTILYANSEYHRMYGYEDGELIGASILDLCATDAERLEVSEALRELIATRPTPTPLSSKRKRRDGSLIDVDVAWNYRLDPDGGVAGFTAVATDVSERTRNEQAMLEREERYQLAIGGTNEGLWDRNLLAGDEYWSPHLYEMFGFEPDEIEPSYETFKSRLHPDDFTATIRRLGDHLVERIPYDTEFRFRMKSGEYRWFRSRGQALMDDADVPVRMVGFTEDVTEHRRVQSALRETRQILDSTPDPMLIVDESGKIVFSNSQADKSFGYGHGELVGKPVDTLMPVEGRLVNPQKRADYLADPVTRQIGDGDELRAVRKDGSEFAVEVRLSPIHSDSGLLVAAAIRDITERKQAEHRQQTIEAKLQQAQKLESLGVLAGGIAHDFNNLLMGVLGNAEVALLDLPPDSPARTELSNISAAALRAAELTKQMLAYSGRGKVKVEPVDLSTLVRDIGSLLDVSTPKRVTVDYEFAEGLPPIDADVAQVQQVVMNLIINASESIEEGNGVVNVVTSQIHVDRAFFADTYLDDKLPEGDYVCLEVSDTGCGMDEETQQKIFDPFFSTKFAGRGLGLAAVLGIIRGHGGALKIDSSVGQGSSFKVLLPASGQLVREPILAAANERWRGSGTVLVVDDEEAVRVAATRMIETCGLTVLAVSDGDEAIRTYREHRDAIVAVLLDQTMPRMNGEQTLRELRLLSPDVRVILSSGYNELETTDRFAGMGLSAFIQKPYGVNHLVGTLRSVLETRSSSPA